MQPVNESKKQTKRWYKKSWGKILIAVMVLYFGSALLVRFTTDPNAKQDPNPVSVEDNKPVKTEDPKPKAPSYEIKIAGNTYADPTSRRLTFTVKNTGTTESNPACSISMSNEAGTYNGSDYVTWETPLAPGDTKYFEGLIVITNEGASYATKSNVSCVERQY
jgi:hypothetical protein